MRKPLHALLIPAVMAAPLLACGQGRVVNNDEYGDDSRRARVAGRLGGSDGFLVLGTDRTGRSNSASGDPGGQGSTNALGVNAFLWRATLDTLSFMPLAGTPDPFGGVVVTDWYSPPAAQGERFRATAYILARQLRSDGVRVAVFRQELRNGIWQDAPVAQATATDLEDKILARARELRSQTASS